MLKNGWITGLCRKNSSDVTYFCMYIRNLTSNPPFSHFRRNNYRVGHSFGNSKKNSEADPVKIQPDRKVISKLVHKTDCLTDEYIHRQTIKKKHTDRQACRQTKKKNRQPVNYFPPTPSLIFLLTLFHLLQRPKTPKFIGSNLMNWTLRP